MERVSTREYNSHSTFHNIYPLVQLLQNFINSRFLGLHFSLVYDVCKNKECFSESEEVIV